LVLAVSPLGGTVSMQGRGVARGSPLDTRRVLKSTSSSSSKMAEALMMRS
jgi:hypothetical protein